MADSPSKYKDEVFCYTVYSGGKDIGEKYHLITASVRLGVNRIGKATLGFEAGDIAARTFAEPDADVFKPGAEIRVEFGRKEKKETVFRGKVVSLNLDILPGRSARMIVECRDDLFPSTQVRRNRIFEKMKDSEIISKVLGAYVPAGVDATDFKHETLVQHYASDWDFALSRAETNGLLVICKDGKVNVKKPDLSAKAILTVTYGVDMIGFNGGLSVTDQAPAVEAVSWDPAAQKIVKVTSVSPGINKQGNIAYGDLTGKDKLLLQTDAPADSSVLQKWADAVALRNALARFRGEIIFHGNAGVIPGCIIELDGLGARFNGNAFIGEVEHIVRDHVWTTKAGMGIPPQSIMEETDVVAPLASGWLPGIGGLHIGKIKQLDKDPAKQQQILVELPWLNGDKNNVWARWVQFYGGNGYGSFFVPEAGDEVVVGFFNNDPGHPVILGSMYSSKLLPPYELTAENYKKAFVTKGKMKLEFDEEKKVITLVTPGNNCVVLDDDGTRIKLSDQNKNEIIMDKNGILLNSAGKIVLKAKKDISGEASGKVAVTAKMDVELNGMNIKATAKTGFTAKGNATAELSASGQTTIKGGIVMIN